MVSAPTHVMIYTSQGKISHWPAAEEFLMGGRGGNWVSYAVAFLVSYVVLFVAVPFVAAVFMHKGFEKYKVPDVPFRQCVQACFYAASATIVIAFLLSFVVP